MTGYVRTFEGNATLSFKISNKQLLKKYNHIWVEKLNSYGKCSKPVYGDDDKYIKAKIKIYCGSVISSFQEKKCQKKKHHAMFINNNARFCYQSKEKVLFSNTLGRM